MSLFDTYYGEKSQSELDNMRGSEKFLIGLKKERVKKYLQTCFDGAIETNIQNVSKLEDDMLKAKIALINGDQSQFRKIMELRFIKEETEKQTVFLNELREEIFK